jgi:NADH-quinone oxidoreductase subunit L
MTIPLIVLAIGAALTGFLGVPEGLSGGAIPNYFEHMLEPSIAHPTEGTATHEIRPGVGEPAGRDLKVEERGATPAHSEDHTLEWILTGVSVVIAFAGLGVGWSWFKKNPLWKPPRLLEDKYYVDEAYNAAVVQPIKVGSTRVLWRFIDVRIIDGAVNGAAYLASRIGNGLRYMQLGLARGYVAVVVLGALIIIGYFIIK